MEIHFHPELRVVDALKIAKALGCVLRFRNGRVLLVRRK